MRFWVFLISFILTGFIFILLIYGDIRKLNEQPVPDEVIAGKLVFQDKACIECHTLFGNGGYFGGDLTKVWEEKGAGGLGEFFANPPLLPGAKERRHLKLTEEEANVLSRFLQYINEVDILGWPPEPLHSGKN